jgi:hypothetical protein
VTDFDEAFLASLPSFDLAHPPELWTLDQIDAFLAKWEASKRIAVCASDVFERVRDAMATAGLDAHFKVTEQSWLPDGQVVIVDPKALEPPPFEMPDWVAPRFRCENCLYPVYLPGPCIMCKEYKRALYAPKGSIIAGGTP